jgi:hypothetical protein
VDTWAVFESCGICPMFTEMQLEASFVISDEAHA